jgi:hypothetical protein
MDTLETLGTLAASTDAESQATAAAAIPVDPNASPPPPSHEEQAVDLVNMFAGLVTSYAPDAAGIWSPEARAASAAVMAPVMAKYNFSMDRIPPELAAAVVVGPLLWQTSKIVALKMKEGRAQPAPEAPAATGTAEQPADTAPGAPVHTQMALYAKT